MTPMMATPMLTTLVQAETLLARLGETGLRIIDCRHELARPAAGREGFLAAHLPGAAFMHMDEDLSAPCNGSNGRHPLPDPVAFASRLEALGVSDDTQVIVCDAQGGMMAARLWWMLRWLGHDAVAVLDGGLPRWQALGLPLEAGPAAERPRGRLTLRLRDVLVDARTVAANQGPDRFTLIDARGADRYRGENETLDPVAGHVPGAINRPFAGNLGPDGRFRDAQALRAAWQPLLPAGEAAQTVHMCGSGVSACHNLLALEIAGLPGARLYAGSWSEWCSDPARPVATGAQPGGDAR
jgi:thiosulfate/3-mercaptopyruvate sulfurtransferase